MNRKRPALHALVLAALVTGIWVSPSNAQTLREARAPPEGLRRLAVPVKRRDTVCVAFERG